MGSPLGLEQRIDEAIIIMDELIISTRESRMEVREMVEMTGEMIRRTDEMIRRSDEALKESREYRRKLDESNREEIFELIDIEIRRWYSKGSRNTTPEKHEAFLKLQESDYREKNVFTDTEELIQKYIRLRNFNDYNERYDKKYYEEHKLLVILESVITNVLQGYIVQFLMFLTTGKSYGRYEGYWDKSPENKLSVNNIEDIGKNHGEKLEVNMPLIINDINNSITNTLCFFSPSNEPEKNEVLIQSLQNQQLK